MTADSSSRSGGRTRTLISIFAVVLVVSGIVFRASGPSMPVLAAGDYLIAGTGLLVALACGLFLTRLKTRTRLGGVAFGLGLSGAAVVHAQVGTSAPLLQGASFGLALIGLYGVITSLRGDQQPNH
jgi:hypothetical protein